MMQRFQTPPFIKKMIWLFVGCFLIQGLMNVILVSPVPTTEGFAPELSQAITQHYFLEIVGLVPQKALLEGYVWQFFTYMLFHGNMTHLLFNMLALWMFGSELCLHWKPKYFTFYFLICGIGSAMFHVLSTYLFFADTTMQLIPTIGASGAIYGILMAYAIFFGNRMILFFFIFPMRAKTAVLIIGGIELFYSITQTQDGVAHLAHLGGMAVGYLFLKYKDWGQRFRYKRYQNQRSKLKDKLRVIVDNEKDWGGGNDNNDDDPTVFH
jgi:membrane associated rhomboid family serine protease